jgi:hypothetical protein
MGVMLERIPIYNCICDNCKKREMVKKDWKKIYNGASAVRSLGWSFGKDGTVLCKNCRMNNYNDHYKWGK